MSTLVSETGRFIALEGNIGVGKTTLLLALQEAFPSYETLFEPVDKNPYLPLFLADKARYGGIMQMFLLGARNLDHQHARWCGHGVLQDRTIYGDTVFARYLLSQGLMSEMDWATYTILWEGMIQNLVVPDLIIYLRADPLTCMERIHHRARLNEGSSYSLDYVQGIGEGYEVMIDELSHYARVHTFDWTKPTDKDFWQICELIRREEDDVGWTWRRRRTGRGKPVNMVERLLGRDNGGKTLAT